MSPYFLIGEMLFLGYMPDLKKNNTSEQLNTNVIQTSLMGKQLLADTFLNKGSSFPADERRIFGLDGLLPPHISTMKEQLQRTYENFLSKNSDIEKFIFLASLQDRNETLFYRLLQTHISEMVPIIYTPTVGLACQRYSHMFRRARGLYLAYPDRDRLSEIIDNFRFEDVSIIVVTDGERILGLGDLGVGGMNIPVGKLALYSLCAGIHPQKTLPILLDVGTNNKNLINDPLYLGWRNPRLKGKEYDEFIHIFIEAVKKKWPRAIVQWEDFSKGNAWRLLERYRSRLASFNDDIQGTAAVALAGLFRGTRAAGRSLSKERVVIAGAGSSATGIAELIHLALKENGVSDSEIKKVVWLVDTHGLVHQGRTDLSEEKKHFAQVIGKDNFKNIDISQAIDLAAIVNEIKPTVLIGTTGTPGLFHESIVRSMAASVERPIILPLSNPTLSSEATPEDLFKWTNGKALVATGSPFGDVIWEGKKVPIGQCNNALIFPGVGLGLICAQAKYVPNDVFLVAARVLSEFDKRLPGYEAMLFPNLEHVQEVSTAIAIAVAEKVIQAGLSAIDLKPTEVAAKVKESMWKPVYPKLQLEKNA